MTCGQRRKTRATVSTLHSCCPAFALSSPTHLRIPWPWTLQQTPRNSRTPHPIHPAHKDELRADRGDAPSEPRQEDRWACFGAPLDFEDPYLVFVFRHGALSGTRMPSKPFKTQGAFHQRVFTSTQLQGLNPEVHQDG